MKTVFMCNLYSGLKTATLPHHMSVAWKYITIPMCNTHTPPPCTHPVKVLSVGSFLKEWVQDGI